MDEQTQRLISRFDLAAEVRAFVAGRAAALAKGPQRFFVRGHRRPCRSGVPHIPHVVGHYDTVRAGTLQYFCEGQSGDGLEVVVERAVRGDAETAAVIEGYWIAAEPAAAD